MASSARVAALEWNFSRIGADGPIKVSLCAATASANAAFSERKPYPG